MTKPGRDDAGAMVRERRRLRLAFGVALAAAASPTGFLACQGASSTTAPDAATQDSSLTSPDAEAPESGLITDAMALPEGTVQCITALEPDSEYYPPGSEVEICHIILSCGLPYGYATVGCSVIDTMQDGMPIGCDIPDDAGCSPDALVPNAALVLTCHCDMFIGGGRRPPLWRRDASCARGRDPLGLHFAHMAAEEAASVHAFGELRRDLTRLGAPGGLCRAAGKAMADEVRHAMTMGRLARERGVELLSVRPGRRAPVSLERLARENMAEGCVRETYGALLAHWQAQKAAHPAVRSTLARIAEDETRHAALAWAIAGWAKGRLDAKARSRVSRAHLRAVKALEREIAAPADETVARAAGLPSPAEGKALLASLVRQLAV